MIAAAAPICQYLLDSSLGTSAGEWPVTIGFMPDTPNNIITVYDTAGEPDGRVMKTGERIEHPGVQILVRGGNYPTTLAKIISIARSLDRQIRTLIAVDSESLYILHNVKRTSLVIPLGMEKEDDKRRHLFSVNAVITIQER